MKVVRFNGSQIAAPTSRAGGRRRNPGETDEKGKGDRIPAAQHCWQEPGCGQRAPGHTKTKGGRESLAIGSTSAPAVIGASYWR